MISFFWFSQTAPSPLVKSQSTGSMSKDVFAQQQCMSCKKRQAELKVTSKSGQVALVCKTCIAEVKAKKARKAATMVIGH